MGIYTLAVISNNHVPIIKFYGLPAENHHALFVHVYLYFHSNVYLPRVSGVF